MDIDSAPHQLLAVAELARAAGTGFHPFTSYCPNAAPEITDVISKCFAISSGLQNLAQAIERLILEDDFVDYECEINELAFSVDYTFKDVRRLIGEEMLDAHEDALSTADAHRRTWRRLCEFFEAESRNRLAKRLAYYVDFIQRLTDVMSKEQLHDPYTFDDLAERIGNLYLIQKPHGTDRTRLEPEVASPPLGLGMPKPRSFERRRPSHSHLYPDRCCRSRSRPRSRRRRDSYSPYRRPRRQSSPCDYHRRHPRSPYRASRRQSPTRRHRPCFHSSHSGYHSPTSPPMEPSCHSPPRGHGWGRHPPPAPDPPWTPAPRSEESSSATGSSTGSSRISERPSGPKQGRWVRNLFKQRPSCTSLTATGMSGCWASHQTDCVTILEERGFEKILELPFENATLQVSFWQEPYHHRAKIVCDSRPSSGKGSGRKVAGKTLTDLYVERSGCFLKLKDVVDQRTWAALRFAGMEDLVIFHSLFLVLRSQAPYDPLVRIRDHNLKGEETIYEEVIRDDRYERFLKLIRDKDSGCIRLQASVLEGHSARTPVWTSFITHSMYSPLWLKRADSKVVHLAVMDRYIFEDEKDYTPQVSPGGAGVLVFLDKRAADAFEEAVYEVAKKGKEKEKERAREKRGR